MTELNNNNIGTEGAETPSFEKATDRQLNFIIDLQTRLKDYHTTDTFLKQKHKEKIADLTKHEASELIDLFLKGE